MLDHWPKIVSMLANGFFNLMSFFFLSLFLALFFLRAHGPEKHTTPGGAPSSNTDAHYSAESCQVNADKMSCPKVKHVTATGI